MRSTFGEMIRSYEVANGPLPGIRDEVHRSVFVEQLVESKERSDYFSLLRARDIGPHRSDPNSLAFDPLRAAIHHLRRDDFDEALWMIFLYVHFGKHRRSGWRLIADVYGRLGQGLWTWNEISGDVAGFRRWLSSNLTAIRSREPRRGFGNHRKYESLDPWSDHGTGAVVASYVDWVGPSRSHEARIAELLADSSGGLREDFEALFNSLKSVRRFGRTGAFDYCASLSKLDFVQIEPGKTFLAGSTGPLAGARLLVCEPSETLAANSLEPVLGQLQEKLNLGFDTMEDALCNWQKSPGVFRPFRG